MTNKPLQVLIIEDHLSSFDYKNYLEYPESKEIEIINQELETIFESNKSDFEILAEPLWKKRMTSTKKIIEKASKFPIKITHRYEYPEDLEELVEGKEVIITDIGLDGPEYEISDSKYKLEELEKNLKKILGENWREKMTLRDIPFEGMLDDDEFYFHNIHRPKTNMGGLIIAEKVEKMGKRITMYTSEIIGHHGAPYIFWGTVNNLIKLEDSLKIQELPVETLMGHKVGSIDKGRIVVGHKTIGNYVKAIEIARDYQMGDSE